MNTLRAVRIRLPWRGILISLVLLVLFPLLLMPIGAIFVFATRDGLSRFVTALTGEGAQFALRLSLFTAIITSVVNSALGALTAYVFSNYRFPGKRSLGILINLPVAIPTVVVGTSLLLLWGPIGLLGRILDPLGFRPMFAIGGILLAHVFVTFPYMLGAVKPVLDELEVTYEEAAYTMGAGKLKTFWYVVLPSLRGALFTGTLLTFAHSLGEFGATVMVSGNLRLRTQTAPLYIFSQFEAGNIEGANAVAAVLATFSFVIFLVLLRVTEREQPEKI
ncbi:MAG: ABC transporter permease subunit [Candidatus Manganitrophaceae bacterium]